MVRFVCLERMKNAVDATIKQYHHTNVLHDVYVSIDLIDGENDNTPNAKKIMVKIRDMGIGIGRGGGDGGSTTATNNNININYNDYIYNLQHNFLSNTYKSSVEVMSDTNVSYQPSSPVLSGLGIGLYLSTIYAEYFGGNLKICNNYNNDNSDRSDINTSSNSDTCSSNRFISNTGAGVTAIYEIPIDIDIMEKNEF